MHLHTRAISIIALVVFLSPVQSADFHRYMPTDAKMVILVRARLLLDGPLVDRDKPFTIKAFLKEDYKDPEFFSVKPLDDISLALIALPNLGDVARVFVALEGKFDPAAIRAAVARQFKDSIKEHGQGAGAFQEFRIEERKFLGVTTPTVVFLAVPDRNTCLISLGSRDDMAAALGDKKAGTPQLLRELIEKSDKDQVASFALFNQLGGPLVDRKELMRAFSLIQTIHGFGRIDEEVSGNLIITAGDAEQCRQASDIFQSGINTITGAVAFLAGANKDLKPVLDVLRTVHISTKGTKFTIRGKLERDALEELIKRRQELQNRK
jgi:hypothetical protein